MSWSNFLENRRKNTPCTSESPCCMLALAKVQTGNSFTVSAHMELLVSNGLPSLVLHTVRPLIPPNKEKLKCIPWVCYLHVPNKIELTGFFEILGVRGFVLWKWIQNSLACETTLWWYLSPFLLISARSALSAVLSDCMPWRCFSVVKNTCAFFFYFENCSVKENVLKICILPKKSMLFSDSCTDAALFVLG